MMNEINPYLPPESDLVVEPTEGAPLASRAQRFGGALIDGLLSIALVFAITWATDTWELLAAGPAVANYAFSFVLGMGVFLLLQGALLKTRGQTVGKVLIGTRIVSQKDERILPLSRILLLRYVPFSLLSGIPLIGSLTGFIDAVFIFREDHLCLHDHLARTKVIQVGSGAAAEPESA